jgi:hypothetical protein
MQPLTSNQLPVLPVGAVSLKENNLGINHDHGNIMEAWNSDKFYMVLAPLDNFRPTAARFTDTDITQDAADLSAIPSHITLRIIGVSSQAEVDQYSRVLSARQPDDRYVSLAHDQTHKLIGHSLDHRVMAVIPATEEGLRQLRTEAGRSTIQMLVLK